MSASARAHKVVFVGDSGVGKTSILHSLLGQSIRNLPNTVGHGEFNYDGFSATREPIPLSIWDTAGQDAYQSLIPSYVRGAQAVLFTFDVTEDVSFGSIPSWVEIVEGTTIEPMRYIVANKVDLEAKRVISFEQGNECAASLNAKYMETSAETGMGIHEVFNDICQEIGARKTKKAELTTQPEPVRLDNPVPQSQSPCC
jgi:small GTP-binding protein